MAPSVSPSPTTLLGEPWDPSTQGPGSPRWAVINGLTVRLEIADDEAERRRGLSGRASLPEDQAMLFVYEREARYTFWMKDVSFPLDLLFLDSQGYVVDVQSMAPQPGVSDDSLTRYPAAHPARYAVELNGGLATQYSVAPGTRVRFYS